MEFNMEDYKLRPGAPVMFSGKEIADIAEGIRSLVAERDAARALVREAYYAGQLSIQAAIPRGVIPNDPKTFTETDFPARLGEVRAPRAPHSDEIDSTNEPELVRCTMRDDFDGIGDDPSGWSLECRFSDGQKYGAVTIDRPFAKLAWKIMDFLNGEK